MTQNEIIEMARQAGIDIEMWEKLSIDDDVFGYGVDGTHENLEAFVNLVAAKEREALAQQEQEPVAHMNQHGVIHEAGYPWGPTNRLEPLYTTPPQRTWVGLTEEEFQWIYDNGRTPAGMMEIVEAKLKELNT